MFWACFVVKQRKLSEDSSQSVNTSHQRMPKFLVQYLLPRKVYFSCFTEISLSIDKDSFSNTNK